MEHFPEDISSAAEVSGTQKELSVIESLPEGGIDEMRKKWAAYNLFSNKLAERIPMIHADSGGNEPSEDAQEFTADSETQDLLIALKNRAGEEMARLNDKIQETSQTAA
ncbi:MAG: hypothetical protein IT406_01700 [Candidatus Yanofskybacteria bacterium]|nr:hypothetical protein [Candidatus Yanofskybacteria bacterium]